jgi:tubulin beta
MKSQAREIIHIQVGRAGNQIGNEFWRDLCQEHLINYEGQPEMKGHYTGKTGDIEEQCLDVFFNEGRTKGQWVPRAILCDLNMTDLSQVKSEPLGGLYRPDNIVGNDEGSGNCYAKAFHTEGPDIADQVLEKVRKEVERCNCLQGIQFAHAVGGGTGSGLTGLLLKTLHDYLDKGSKCVLQSYAVLPSPGVSDVLIEPYNAALALQDLLEYCHQVFVYDNKALTTICEKIQGMAVPKMRNLNNIIALCMSGMTCSLRFPGQLDADLRKMHSNLIPFKNAHFLITGFAPLSSPEAAKYRQPSTLDLAQQMISKDNVTVTCDPLNPGDPKENKKKSRFLASFAAFRGDCRSSEVDKVINQLQSEGSRYDKFFPDWIPNSISSSICDKPHPEYGTSVTFVSNNTAVHEVFERCIESWDSMYKSKSYLHVFDHDGIHPQDMMESRQLLQYVMDQYKEYATWEDKFFEEGRIDVESGKKVPNKKAIQNEEQLLLLEELRDLRDCYIETSH